MARKANIIVDIFVFGFGIALAVTLIVYGALALKTPCSRPLAPLLIGAGAVSAAYVLLVAGAACAGLRATWNSGDGDGESAPHPYTTLELFFATLALIVFAYLLVAGVDVGTGAPPPKCDATLLRAATWLGVVGLALSFTAALAGTAAVASWCLRPRDPLDDFHTYDWSAEPGQKRRPRPGRAREP